MSSEQRIYAHYKSMKRQRRIWVTTKKCGFLSPCGYFPHLHGHYDIITETSNEDWLLLAKIHKKPVREIKDIVSKIRGYTPKAMIGCE